MGKSSSGEELGDRCAQQGEEHWTPRGDSEEHIEPEMESGRLSMQATWKELEDIGAARVRQNLRVILRTEIFFQAHRETNHWRILTREVMYR